MKTKHSRKSRKFTAPKRRGILPPGAVQLGFERLEERNLMAADFQNPYEQCDVNSDGAVNRGDVITLIAELRKGGERRLSSSQGAAEGESLASRPMFLDVNGDSFFNRRDVFAVMGRLRAEGEQDPDNPPGALMAFDLRIFSADGLTEFVDPDGPGGQGVPIAKDTDFLVRLFVRDPVDQGRTTRGIAAFGLNMYYGDVPPPDPPQPGSQGFPSPTALVQPNLDATAPPFTNAADTTFVDPYDGFTGRPGEVVFTESTIKNISAQLDTTALLAANTVGGNFILALEIPFRAGTTLGTFEIHTLDFDDPNLRQSVNVRQDNTNGNPQGPGNPNGNPDNRIPNSQVDDDLIEVSIVEGVTAIDDNITLHEQATPATPINIFVLANDIVPAGRQKSLSLANTDPNPDPNVLETANGSVVVNNNNTANPSDDFLVYTPNVPYFVGVETFNYTLTEGVPIPGQPGQFTPGLSDEGTVRLDFREFNFPPIVGADPAINVDQGSTTLVDTLLDNDNEGDPNDNSFVTVNFQNEEELNQEIKISNVGITFSTGIDAVRVVGTDSLEIDANPTFVGTATITYFVEDNGVEQSLTPGTPALPPAAVVTPKRTQNTLTVNIGDVADLARFTVKFFDAISGQDISGEIGINKEFIARIFVEDLRSPAAPVRGASDAFIDLQYFDGLPPIPTTIVNNNADTFTSDSNVIDVTISPDYAPGDKHLSLANPGLVDNTGGSTLVSPALNPAALFEIRMLSGGTSSTHVTFQPLFAANQGGVVGQEFVALFGRGPLRESEIQFVIADLLVAAGERPVPVDDVYTILEDVPPTGTFSVTDAGNRTGDPANQQPEPPVRGVLNNDTDVDFADPNNFPLTAELVTGPIHGTLAFRDDGTFDYTPDPNFHGIGANVDTFTYRVRDNNGRASLDVGTVTINITTVPDAPVANDDTYNVDVLVPVLVVNDPGNRTGDPANQQPEPPDRGFLNNDTDDDSRGPDVAIDPLELRAQIVSLANVLNGTLALEDANNPGVFVVVVTNNGGVHIETLPGNFQTTGAFTFTPNAGVPPTTDFFEYQAIDVDTLDPNGNPPPAAESTSNTARVNLLIGLQDIQVTGTVYADNNRNGQFDFTDNDASGSYNAGDLAIDRTLGGVKVVLTGFDARTGLAITRRETFTDAAGRFSFGVSSVLPAGTYTIEEDPDGALRFLLDGFERRGGAKVFGSAQPGPDKVDPNSPAAFDAALDDIFNNVTTNEADLFFGEFGLAPAFVNLADFYSSNSREGVTVALDASGNMLWYALDSGTGWNPFQHNVVSAQFSGSSLILEVKDGAQPSFKRSISTGSASYRTLGTDPNGTGRVVRFTGTFAQLRNNFPPG